MTLSFKDLNRKRFRYWQDLDANLKVRAELRILFDPRRTCLKQTRIGDYSTVSQRLSGSRARTFKGHPKKLSAFVKGSSAEKMHSLAGLWDLNL